LCRPPPPPLHAEKNPKKENLVRSRFNRSVSLIDTVATFQQSVTTVTVPHL
jgi:hypothetical protein